MPDFKNREQLLELKLCWVQHRLGKLEDSISDINVCLTALNFYLKELSNYSAYLADRVTELGKLEGYILDATSEISQEIKNLKQL